MAKRSPRARSLPEASDNLTKYCRFCQQGMPANASYCINCDHFQSIWLSVATKLDIGGLVALIPIATLCYVFVRSHLNSEHSDVKAVIVDCTLSNLEIAATNGGTRPGMVSGGTVQKIDDAGSGPLYALRADSGNTILKPGDAALIKMTIHEPSADLQDVNMLPARKDAKCIYKVELNLLGFGANAVNPVPLECKCPGAT